MSKLPLTTISGVIIKLDDDLALPIGAQLLANEGIGAAPGYAFGESGGGPTAGMSYDSGNAHLAFSTGGETIFRLSSQGIRVHPAGSAATPSIYSDKDTDVGILWPGATNSNRIAIATGGLQAVEWDGSQNQLNEGEIRLRTNKRLVLNDNLDTEILGNGETQIRYRVAGTIMHTMFSSLNQSLVEVDANIGATAQTQQVGFGALNQTAAVTGAAGQRYSPMVAWEGAGFATTPVESQRVRMAAQLETIEGAGNPTGELVFKSNINEAGWVDILSIDSTGGITADADGNSTFILGKALFDTRNGDGLFLSHYDYTAIADTALSQSGANGITTLNSPNTVRLAISNVVQWQVSTSLFSALDANGPQLANVAQTNSNTAFRPDKSFNTTGIGGTANVIVVRNNAMESVRWDATQQQHNASHINLGILQRVVFDDDADTFIQTIADDNLVIYTGTVQRFSFSNSANTSNQVLRSVAPGIAQAETSALELTNTTAATVSNQEFSPMLVWEGQGWKTDATAVSREVLFAAQLETIQGTANPSGNLVFKSNINGAGYVDVMSIDSAGNLDVLGNVSATELATTGADVNIDAAAPPTTGQTLVATSATTATWQAPPAGSLDASYDAGSTITVDAGAVVLDADSADGTDALTITREPGSSAGAKGFAITMGANCSNLSRAFDINNGSAGGGSISINQSGTGGNANAVLIARNETTAASGTTLQLFHSANTTGKALHIVLGTSASTGIDITESSSINPGLMFSAFRQAANNNDMVKLTNNGGSGQILDIGHVGTGDAININHSGSAGRAIYAYGESAAAVIEVEPVDEGPGILVDVGGSGLGVDLWMNIGNTSEGVRVTHSGTGTGVNIDHNGSSGSALVLDKASGSGNCAGITNAGTGKSLEINHTGTGQAVDINVTNASSANPALRVDYVGTTEAVIVSHTGSTGTGLSVTNSSSGNTIYASNNSSGTGLLIQRSGSGSGHLCYLDNNTNNSNHSLYINNSSTSSSSNCIQIDHTGKGFGLQLICTGTPAVQGVYVSYNGTSYMCDFRHSGTSGYGIYLSSTSASTMFYMSSTGTGSAVDINNSGGGTALVVDQNYTSGDVAQFYGNGGSVTQINSDCSFRQDTDGNPNAAFTINNPDSGMTSTDSILTLACNTSELNNLYEWIECISASGDIESRHESVGDWHTETGVYQSGAGDYAELLETELAKTNYEEGDVMVISSGGKVDKSSAASMASVIGVYSTNPSVLGNNPISCALMDQGTLETATWVWALGAAPNDKTWNHVEIDGDRTADYPVGMHARMDDPYNNVCFTTVSGSYDSGTDKTSVFFSQNYPNRPPQTELYYDVPERDAVPVGMLGLVPTKCITENGTINPGDLLVTSTTSGCAMKAPASPAYGTVLGRAFELLTDTGSQNDIQLIDCLVSI